MNLNFFPPAGEMPPGKLFQREDHSCLRIKAIAASVGARFQSTLAVEDRIFYCHSSRLRCFS